MPYWTEEETKRLVDGVQTKSYSALLKDFPGRTRESLRQHYKEISKINSELKRQSRGFNLNELLVTAKNDVLITLPKRYTEFIQAKETKAVVFCDPHLPYLDWDLFEKMLLIARIQNIDICCVGGDVFDCPMFSNFPDSDSSGNEDLKNAKLAGKRFFTKLLDTFKKIYVISGNHDFRLFKFTEGKMSINRISPTMSNPRTNAQ